jgi:hypothetical protein
MGRGYKPEFNYDNLMHYNMAFKLKSCLGNGVRNTLGASVALESSWGSALSFADWSRIKGSSRNRSTHPIEENININ